MNLQALDIDSPSPSHLSASIDLLKFMNDSIPLPPSITHVVIESGTHGQGLLWDTPFAHNVPGIQRGVPISEQKHVLLVSFEPLLDRYTAYLSIRRRTVRAVKGLSGLMHSGVEIPSALGWSVPGRAIVLPHAIGSHDGEVLCPIQGEAAARRVPTISLRSILHLLPNQNIAFAKIGSCGGQDLVPLLVGGSEALSRIGSIELQTKAERCVDVLTYTASLGFQAAAWLSARGWRPAPMSAGKHRCSRSPMDPEEGDDSTMFLLNAAAQRSKR